MTEDHLNGLALMKFHQDIKLDPNDIVEEFARSHPRRIGQGSYCNFGHVLVLLLSFLSYAHMQTYCDDL